MSVELVKALLAILRFCTVQQDCGKCPLKEFCGKQPLEW